MSDPKYSVLFMRDDTDVKRYRVSPFWLKALAWCLGGVHDRPWPSRPVFGSVRSMTAAGMARKFDVEAYCRRAAALPPSP